jgi:DHA1 family bicyclomycin/chloramphenicol resistance-like MFS transporter
VPQRCSPLFLISLLGALSVISPFAIDMYLAAFPQVAEAFDVPSAMVSLTLSSYFIGLALGQLFYGPLLDRFGRKKPLFGGLGLFILASAGCAFASHIDALIGWRFVQALGGCVAGVASLAMVQDFFPIGERAKIMSRLFLFISASPMLAPTIGGMVALTFGWQSVFLLLAIIIGLIMVLIYFQLPEGHVPDASISLKPGPILREYAAIFKHPRFMVYALSGAFSFAGLFTYVAGSPIIFMDGFGLSPHAYSLVFAVLAAGFIGSSQFNVMLLRRFSSEQLFLRMLLVQTVAGALFLLTSLLGGVGLIGTMLLFFAFLSCVGITYPNAATLALAPFSKNTGSASALLGFLQLGVGAFISTFISLSHGSDSGPIMVILAGTSAAGLAIVLLGRKRAAQAPVAE